MSVGRIFQIWEGGKANGSSRKKWKNKKAIEEYDRLMADEETRKELERIKEARQERRLELGSARYEGREEGRTEGRIEGESIGISIGKNIGIEQGRSIGLEQGKSIGLEQGKSIGLEQGKSIGLEQGKSIGLEQGTKEERTKNLKAMLKEGLSEELIAKIIGISKKEVKKEKASMKI